MLAFATALLLATSAQLPAPELSEAGDRLELTADAVEVSRDEALVRAEGAVRLQSGGVRLRCELLEYDFDQGLARAADRVLFVDGNVALVADEGSFRLREPATAEVRGATLYQKGPGQAGLLAGVEDPQGAAEVGTNALVLRAESIQRVARSRFIARSLSLTPCNCPGTRPDWEIVASKADVQPGDRALLSWPRFYVRGIPVMALPWVYLPLSPRRTGFLIPRVAGFGSGLILDLPLFVTLGSSYDLTLTGGYRFRPFGEPPATVPTGARLGAELRYAPAEHTWGRVGGLAMDDRGPDVEGGPARGWRGEVELRHSTRGARFNGQAEAHLVSDKRFLTDHNAMLLLESQRYLRSQAHVDWRTEAMLLSGATQWYQDLSVSTGPLFGADANRTVQRPAVLLFELPRTSLAGPLSAGLSAVAEHYRPVPRGGAALERLDVAPTVALDLLGSGPVQASAYAGARGQASGYTPLVGAEPTGWTTRGHAWAGAQARTELARSFGTLRHSIEPRTEIRALTGSAGPPADWPELVDEYDLSRPPRVQAVAALATRLSSGGTTIARLELGQGAELAEASSASDTFGRLDLKLGPASLSGGGRYDPEQHKFASLNAGVRLDSSRGDAISVTYDQLLGTGSARLRAGLDELFGPVSAGSRGESNQLTGVAVLRPTRTTSLSYTATYQPFRKQMLLHSAVLGVGTGCECWKLDVVANYFPGVPPPHDLGFSFRIDLKYLGSIGK